MSERQQSLDRGPMAIGVVLIGLGVIFLAGQILNVDIGAYGWPFFVIVPGAAILVVALVLPGPAGVGLAIAGAITLITGLVLLAQDLTTYYESWAYAWALVAPGGVGVGLFLEGLAHGDRNLVDGGLRTTFVGLALFLGFGIFFELIGLGGNPPVGLRTVVLPGGVILLGVAILVSGLLSNRRHAG